MAQRLHAAGKNVLVIEKRDHIAGNVYTKNVKGMSVVVMWFMPALFILLSKSILLIILLRTCSKASSKTTG